MLSLHSVRRTRFASLAALTILTFVAYSSYNVFASVEDQKIYPANVVPGPQSPSSISDAITPPVLNVDNDTDTSHSPFVLGPPSKRFRENLRNDTKYITSWISAGWSTSSFSRSSCPYSPATLANDIITYANLIYLGTITDRVPVMPMFTPSHIGGDADPIPFGDVFDVPRFIRDSGINIVEWRDVKQPDSDVLEDLGCWNVWEAVQYYEHFPRNSAVPNWLKLGE